MNAGDRSSGEKFEAVNRFLSGDYVLVHLNPRQTGVELPEYLLRGPSVTLKLSRLFRGAMEVNEDKITAELLFSGNYFTCSVPLQAVWGLTSERGENLIWPDSTPKEVLRDILAQTLQAPDKQATKPSDPSEEQPPSGERKLPSKGHLKRVK